MNIFLQIFIASVGFVSLFRLFSIYRSLGKKNPKSLSLPIKMRLSVLGFFSYILDTIGVGSYAVIVAANHAYKFIPSKSLAGTLNAHGILPAVIQSVFFIQLVNIEFITLIVLLSGSILGAFLGSSMAVRIKSSKIETCMLFAYICMGLVVFTSQMQWLPIGGEDIELQGNKLILGFLAMTLVGLFPAFGAGSYAPTQMLLFILGLAPLVAFPIMCASCTIQQSVGAIKYSSHGLVANKVAFILSISGVVGTLLAIPLVTSFSSYHLRWLLFIIIIYNIIMMLKNIHSSTVFSNLEEPQRT